MRVTETHREKERGTERDCVYQFVFCYHQFVIISLFWDNSAPQSHLYFQKTDYHSKDFKTTKTREEVTAAINLFTDKNTTVLVS